MLSGGDSLCLADESASGLFLFFLLTERFLEILIFFFFSQRPIDDISHILKHLSVVVVFVAIDPFSLFSELRFIPSVLKGNFRTSEGLLAPSIPALRCHIWAPAEAVGVRRLAEGPVFRF